MMGEAKTDVLAFTAFPKAHWQKIWSNNPISVIRTSRCTVSVSV
jgi:transposase-like protein